MRSKLFIVLGILVVLTMVLGACTPKATGTPGYPAAGEPYFGCHCLPGSYTANDSCCY